MTRRHCRLILQMLCAGLAVLVAVQFAAMVARRNALPNLVVPVAALEKTDLKTKLTNAPVTAPSVIGETNAAITKVAATNAKPSGRSTSPVTRRPSAPKAPDLPPEVQKRVDLIVQSEILGPVIRPLPMALLGIAGRDAFLRAPNGQTGLLREGEELGGIKLLRIGTNRVLVEESGEQKELTVFAGLGGDSLMPAGKEKPK